MNCRLDSVRKRRHAWRLGTGGRLLLGSALLGGLLLDVGTGTAAPVTTYYAHFGERTSATSPVRLIKTGVEADNGGASYGPESTNSNPVKIVLLSGFTSGSAQYGLSDAYDVTVDVAGEGLYGAATINVDYELHWNGNHITAPPFTMTIPAGADAYARERFIDVRFLNDPGSVTEGVEVLNLEIMDVSFHSGPHAAALGEHVRALYLIEDDTANDGYTSCAGGSGSPFLQLGHSTPWTRTSSLQVSTKPAKPNNSDYFGIRFYDINFSADGKQLGQELWQSSDTFRICGRIVSDEIPGLDFDLYSDPWHTNEVVWTTSSAPYEFYLDVGFSSPTAGVTANGVGLFAQIHDNLSGHWDDIAFCLYDAQPITTGTPPTIGQNPIGKWLVFN